MTDSEKLERLIKASGYKKGFIAEKLGLSRGGLYNCINNKDNMEFKASQIDALCELLNIEPEQRTAIFFAKSVV